MRSYNIGVIQMNTVINKNDNLKAACELIDEAASKGAKLVALPEVFNTISNDMEEAEDIPGGHTITLMSEKAKQHNLWIHCGSIPEANPNDNRTYNTTAMLNPKGELIAKYRKLHTFDITLPDGRVIAESAYVKPGSEIVTAKTELGNFGFTICYDIRFPELFRLLALNGAQIIFTPANFAMPTGKDHWETILKARAVENGCYIVAPAQIGKKDGMPDSFGASIVVDPWGTIICKAREEACVTMAEIDLDYLEKVRKNLCMFTNRRSDIYDTIKLH